MPLRFSESIEPANRDANVFTNAFFYMMNFADIDISVEKILANASETGPWGGSPTPPVPVLDSKYIVKDINSSPISVANLANNDIVIWDGNNWKVHKKVGLDETNFGLVYDKRTKLLYQYDPDNGWKSLVRSGKIDGGTFV